MLLNLSIDLLKDRLDRMRRITVILAGVYALAGFLSVFVEHWEPGVKGVSILFRETAPNLSAPASPLLLLYLSVLLPITILTVLIFESNSVFNPNSANVPMAILLSYPLPRWIILISRLLYLAGVTIWMLIVCGTGWIVGRVMNSALDPGWSVLAYLPGLILFVNIFAYLGIILGRFSTRLWVGPIMVLLGLIFTYCTYFFPDGAVAGLNLVYFSLLFAYLGESPLVSNPSPVSLVLLLGVNILAGWVLWKIFEKSDLGYLPS